MNEFMYRDDGNGNLVNASGDVVGRICYADGATVMFETIKTGDDVEFIESAVVVKMGSATIMPCWIAETKEELT